MKLRNKKTGDIINITTIINNKEYHSLVEFCEDYEDLDGYKPKEPLIKDPQIRKAVRAWAEANDVDEVLFKYWWDSDVSAEMEVEDAHERNIYVKFNVQKVICDENRIYTIEELCGEEEE